MLLPAVLLLAASTLTLTGCGQKGPLFMPAKAVPAAATAPATPTTAPALPQTPAPVTPQSPAMTLPSGAVVPTNK